MTLCGSISRFFKCAHSVSNGGGFVILEFWDSDTSLIRHGVIWSPAEQGWIPIDELTGKHPNFWEKAASLRVVIFVKWCARHFSNTRKISVPKVASIFSTRKHFHPRVIISVPTRSVPSSFFPKPRRGSDSQVSQLRLQPHPEQERLTQAHRRRVRMFMWRENAPLLLAILPFFALSTLLSELRSATANGRP